MINQIYTIGNKYIVISQNHIQSRKHMVNKITVGKLVRVTNKSYIFECLNGKKYIQFRTLLNMIDITYCNLPTTQYIIDEIEAVLV